MKDFTEQQIEDLIIDRYNLSIKSHYSLETTLSGLEDLLDYLRSINKIRIIELSTIHDNNGRILNVVYSMNVDELTYVSRRLQFIYPKQHKVVGSILIDLEDRLLAV